MLRTFHVPIVTDPRSEPLTEESLPDQLDRLVAGDHRALAHFFTEYGDLVYRTALRLTSSRVDAEDVTQELFLRLPGAVRGFTGTSPSFPGWIRRVAVRQTLMHLRGGRRRREVDVDGVVGLLAPSANDDDRLTLESALERLSDDQRTVFLLKEVEGYAHAEIAELLGISVANSEVRLHRARRSLRNLLGGSR
jgi:RNA polymerase sigma-70 factor (ECF subfamily)